jgi:colanic acid biosynthesis glycosyl transferase WcaI
MLESVETQTNRDRILIYGMNYTPELTGVGRYSGELGQHLAEQGVEVEVVTTPPHYPGWSVRDGYRNRYSVERLARQQVFRCPLVLRRKMSGVWRLLAPLSFSLTSAPVVLWRILARRPNTVICVEPTLFSSPLALLAAKFVGARTVLHVQDLEIDAAFAVGHLSNARLKSLAFGIEKMLLRGFDIVVTISSQMRLRLSEKSVKEDRLMVVRNWVDLDKIVPLPGPNSFRAELGLPTSQYVVLYAGNIGPKQALDLVIDAAEETLSDPEITYVIAGDGPAKAALVARGLSNVKFLPLQPEDRLCELLNLADLHILPQRGGVADLVLPSKLGGMLASDKPLLVQADEGTELFSFLNGVALLVPTGESLALAAAISNAKQSGARSLSGRGRALAKALDRNDALSQFKSIALPREAA